MSFYKHNLGFSILLTLDSGNFVSNTPFLFCFLKFGGKINQWNGEREKMKIYGWDRELELPGN